MVESKMQQEITERAESDMTCRLTLVRRGDRGTKLWLSEGALCQNRPSFWQQQPERNEPIPMSRPILEGRALLQWFGLILFVVALLWSATGISVAAGPTVEVFTENGMATSTGEGYTSFFPQLPFRWFVTASGGYDDNPDTLPDGSGSAFTQGGVTISKELRTERTALTLLATGGVVHYFDRPIGPPTDYNGSVDLLLLHNFSERLTLAASVNATYQAEPEFGSDLGPTRQGGNYFITSDIFGARYAWSPRLSNYTSYQLRMIKYENELASLAQDRSDHTFAESLRYLWSPRTSLTAEYRFALTDYDTAPRDSTTHFVLGGIDYDISARLKASVLGGATSRKFKQGNSDREVHPNVSGTLSYTISSAATLNWTASYSVEEPDTSETFTRTTYRTRTGVEFRYQPKKDLTTHLTVNYYHDENTGLLATESPGANRQAPSQSGFELVADAKYTVTDRIALNLSFAHTELDSANGYSRNIYTTGLSFSF